MNFLLLKKYYYGNYPLITSFYVVLLHNLTYIYMHLDIADCRGTHKNHSKHQVFQLKSSSLFKE